MQETTHHPHSGGDSVHLPKPTAWPMVLALGVSLLVAGLITHVTITVLGAVLAAYAAVGWFRNVLPHEQHESVAVHVTETDRELAAATEPAPPAVHVAPERTYSFISGIEAGLAGGTSMALVAMLYSILHFHSLWYAINLMAASSFLSWTNASDAFLSAFHLQGLLVGLGIHWMISVLIGLLYASVMPIFPRLALISGGVFTPILWTVLAYSVMNSVTPILRARVDWTWFILSQIAFGLTAVVVVGLRVRVRAASFQALPFEERAGLHSSEAYAPARKEVQR